MPSNKKRIPHKLVLLVDDCSVDNFVNQKMIELNRFSEKVIAFTQAENALNYLIDVDKNKSYEQNLPSIIFLDLNMPIMDGYEFIRQFKSLSSKIRENCKIIILTSSLKPLDDYISNDNKHILASLSKPLMKNNFDLINLLVIDDSLVYKVIPTRAV
jgi:CheY-like chemotaxis protein